MLFLFFAAVDWKPILMFVILSIVLLLLWVAAYYCKGLFCPRATFFLHPFIPDYENQALFPLNSPPPPSPGLLNHPPPYEDGQPGFAASPPLCDDTNPTFPIPPPLYDHQSPDVLGLPPPYHPAAPTVPPHPAPYNEDPPPYSVEDPLGHWDRPPPPPSPSPSSGSSGGEADVGPLVHRSASGYSSASTLEADA